MPLQKRVYLDVCALSRPFDDQQQLRIRLETSAVELILAHIRNGSLTLCISPVHTAEIEAISELEEREQLTQLLHRYGAMQRVDLAAARVLAESLVAQRFGVADAAHVAFAIHSQADFVSVDNRLLRQC
jgi:predicted nucleic acid-binding protein